ncbi:MAG: alcohol dehydrogenase catalytic domain-containing protein, partial [Actinomycetota bacterium]
MPTTSPPATATPAEAAPVTMRAAVARRYGGPGVVSVEEVPVPTPGPGEVLVAVRASSLNALDWHFLTGTPYFLRLMAGLRRPKRTIPGADVAGIVTAVGADVTRWSPGDEVFGECEGGACAPYAVVAETNLVAKPEGVAFEDAGSAGVAGLTAVQGLRTHAEVRPGERVPTPPAAPLISTRSPGRTSAWVRSPCTAV